LNTDCNEFLVISKLDIRLDHKFRIVPFNRSKICRTNISCAFFGTIKTHREREKGED